MPVLEFYQIAPLADLPMVPGGGADEAFTMPDGLYDAVETVLSVDVGDGAFANETGRQGAPMTATGAVTLADGTVVADTNIRLEPTSALRWTAGDGATHSVRIGFLEYGPKAGRVSAMVADGRLPPTGTEVTVIAHGRTPGEGGDAFAYTAVTTSFACLARGTRVRTPRGDVAVEALVPGDTVETRDHGVQPVRWIGSRRVPAHGAFAPVVIRAGVLGNTRDLTVSPCHRLLVDGWRALAMFGEPEILVAARQLTRRDDIFVREGGMVEYFHILFDRHEIIYAEGAPCESFLPVATRLTALDTAVRAEILVLFPELRNDDRVDIRTARRALTDSEARTLLR